MARKARRPPESAEDREAEDRGIGDRGIGDRGIGAEGPPRAKSRIWLTARLLLVVLVLVVIWRGRQYLLAWRASLPEHRIDASRLKVLSLPRWLTAEDVASIHRDSGLASAPLSLLSPDLSRRLDEAYGRSPWVSGVSGIRLRPPNRVDIYLELAFGTPVSGVRWRDGHIYLVDGEGRRLPGRRDEAPAGLGRPFRWIEGVETPPPEPGGIWSRPVAEGAWVARELLALEPDASRAARIVSVDVSNVGGRRDRLASEIVLHSAGGTVLEWGRSGLADLGDLDPPPATKLHRLVRSLQAYHDLEGLRRVKLQFDEVIVEEIDDEPVQRISPDVHGG